MFKTKGKKDLNPFKYLNQYCNVKMALIIEVIFIRKSVTSLQINKPIQPRESLLTIEEEDEHSESDIEENNESEDDNIEDLIVEEEEVTE